MNSREAEFLAALQATFKVEAAEHLQAIAAGLLALEKTPAAEAGSTLIATIFRAAHSLKGAARAVNFSRVEAICQSLEEIFAGWKSGKTAPTPAELDAAHRALDQATTELTATAEKPLAAEAIKAVSPPTAPAAAAHAVAAPEKNPGADTIRITVSKLDARLLEAEEMLAAKLAVGQRANDIAGLVSQFEPWRKEWAKIQPNIRALRRRPEHVALAEFVEWNHDYLRSLEHKVAALRKSAENDRSLVGKLVDDLLNDSKKLLMLPLATLGGIFPKVVRDLCRDQGKEAELIVQGEDIEIDKRILEQLKDPLIHLLRNSIDHGVESPQEREAARKPRRATLTLNVTSVGGNRVEITVTDDGAGIDVERLKASAAKRGVKNVESMSDAEALRLIFEPDVSTSPIVTQLSGRGLGLAIVREKTEKLGGRVFVDSRPGAGTAIKISLPVTLATFRGILIRVGERLFVLPTAEVERVTRIKSGEVRTVEGRETIAMDGRAIALVRMADVLELPAHPATAAHSRFVVILGAGEQRTAFSVDALVDEQEVLVKPLQKPLLRVRNVAAATVLGSGQVVPVLRVADLLKSAKKAGAPLRAAEPVTASAAQAKSILLAEDSITSRLLIKGILESAGYRVTTAIDGMEAYTALRAQHFDLVVSDVEMPRLNGFDLAAKIRSDRKLAELPVVLVTALETRDDRERGITAGASAYLVKSRFDQSNLLETVRRLI